MPPTPAKQSRAEAHESANQRSEQDPAAYKEPSHALGHEHQVTSSLSAPNGLWLSGEGGEADRVRCSRGLGRRGFIVISCRAPSERDCRPCTPGHELRLGLRLCPF